VNPFCSAIASIKWDFVRVITDDSIVLNEAFVDIGTPR